MKLGHRVVLAPLTHYQPSDAHVPNDLVVEYYKQRACVPGTLLVTEVALIPRRGLSKLVLRSPSPAMLRC